MSKVFIEESTLTSIGDAIRAKTGATELISPADMATEIEGIESGGGAEIPSDVFLATGDCNKKYANNNWNYFMENEPFKSQWRSENISNAINMFYYSNKLTEIPFTLNFKEDAVNGVNASYMFRDCSALENIPDIGTILYPSIMVQMFYQCKKIKEIPQNWVDNIQNDVLIKSTSANLISIFAYMSSLRKIQEELINKLRASNDSTGTYYSLYYGLVNGCRVLDEIKNIPVYGNYTSNAFLDTFSNCCRLAEIIFETNEDGTAMTADWSNQTIELTKQVGYAYSISDITGGSDDFTSADCYNSNTFESVYALEEAIAANPNWFADDYTTARYTKQSAINTINSLPDTSAYIAANGGTNTIKFKRTQGSARLINGESGRIGDLTAEQIAVATAKGWTVSLT